HIFVHQVLARVLAGRGVTRARLLSGVGRPFCFGDLGPDARAAILDRLMALDVLTTVDSLVVFGAQGERLFGYANFRDLYSVFDTPQHLVVRSTRGQEVGTLEAWFAQALGERFVFVLAGRSWVTRECDWNRGVLIVSPARGGGKIPTWMGSPRVLGQRLCEEMRHLLVSHDPLPFLGSRAQETLKSLRVQWEELLSPTRLVACASPTRVKLHTFAGGRINAVLGRVLQREYGLDPSIDNFAVSYQPEGDPFEPLVQVLERVGEADYWTPEVTRDLVRLAARGRLSRFQPLLPPELEAEFLADRLLDVPGCRALALQDVRFVQSS
ncbi:MAG: hypothetical protein AB1758_38325, partial [Candidatus Eremiobacterota bacterium]